MTGGTVVHRVPRRHRDCEVGTNNDRPIRPCYSRVADTERPVHTDHVPAEFRE